MCVKDSKDFERLYSLDILGVEDRGEDDLSDIHREFNENLVRRKDERYEAKIPWISGSKIIESNDAQSRSRLKSVERKLDRNPELKRAYQDIEETQRKEGIVENTYLDNLMTTGHFKEQLDKYKVEATDILERGKFPVHKWESDIKELESDGMQKSKQDIRL